jgi:hypothetical protein
MTERGARKKVSEGGENNIIEKREGKKKKTLLSVEGRSVNTQSGNQLLGTPSSTNNTFRRWEKPSRNPPPPLPSSPSFFFFFESSQFTHDKRLIIFQ